MATYPPSGFKIDAVICDSSVVAEGKLYVQGGGWDNLGSPVFPFIQSRISLAAVVAVPYIETNKNHVLEIHLEHEDGQKMPLAPQVVTQDGAATHTPTTIKAQFTFGRPATLPAGDSQMMPIAVNLDQLRFESPGAYSFVLSINGTEIERLGFRVIAPPGAIFAGGPA